MLRRFATIFAFILVACPAYSQDDTSFNDFEASEELEELTLLLSNEDIDSDALNAARLRANSIESRAASCASESRDAGVRLEEQFDPLREIEVEGAATESRPQRQYQEIRDALDEAAARQSMCEGLVQEAQDLAVKISARQNQLSQQILSHRTESALALIDGLPERAVEWPAKIRAQFQVSLVEGLTPLRLLWYLIIGGFLAAVVGILLRRRFTTWYQAQGGDDAPPQMKHLFPRPIAEYAPLWLEGAMLFTILQFAIPDSSGDTHGHPRRVRNFRVRTQLRLD